VSGRPAEEGLFRTAAESTIINTICAACVCCWRRAGVNNLGAGCQQKRCVHAATAAAATFFPDPHACKSAARISRARPRTRPRVNALYAN
jgi:hypothetical protein